MCHRCDQLSLIQAICEQYPPAAILSVTEYSVIIQVGSELTEDTASIATRAKSMAIAIKHVDFNIHPFISNLVPMHFIAIMLNLLPGTTPSQHTH